ncbi:MAG: hypothetical protein HY247_05270 [archaeon]|nr:MAG: hypothetical protein HY247_05270 [archaeon]
MQAAPKAPMTRSEKLRWYAAQLMTDAATAEKSGSNGPAISNYLQAAEIYLLLAKVTENYTPWKFYADNAALCQQKARILIATTPKEQTTP